MTLTVRNENGMGICSNTARGNGISYRYWNGIVYDPEFRINIYFTYSRMK